MYIPNLRDPNAKLVQTLMYLVCTCLVAFTYFYADRAYPHGPEVFTGVFEERCNQGDKCMEVPVYKEDMTGINNPWWVGKVRNLGPLFALVGVGLAYKTIRTSESFFEWWKKMSNIEKTLFILDEMLEERRKEDDSTVEPRMVPYGSESLGLQRKESSLMVPHDGDGRFPMELRQWLRTQDYEAYFGIYDKHFDDGSVLESLPDLADIYLYKTEILQDSNRLKETLQCLKEAESEFERLIQLIESSKPEISEPEFPTWEDNQDMETRRRLRDEFEEELDRYRAELSRGEKERDALSYIRFKIKYLEEEISEA
ncbi:hypothetical protein M1N56_05350 [Dehalococcoidia bacterium]|nr:hypothetical protein [Dehalococcoidia bacterium]